MSERASERARPGPEARRLWAPLPSGRRERRGDRETSPKLRPRAARGSGEGGRRRCRAERSVEGGGTAGSRGQGAEAWYGLPAARGRSPMEGGTGGGRGAAAGGGAGGAGNVACVLCAVCWLAGHGELGLLRCVCRYALLLELVFNVGACVASYILGRRPLQNSVVKGKFCEGTSASVPNSDLQSCL